MFAPCLRRIAASGSSGPQGVAGGASFARSLATSALVQQPRPSSTRRATAVSSVTQVSQAPTSSQFQSLVRASSASGSTSSAPFAGTTLLASRKERRNIVKAQRKAAKKRIADQSIFAQAGVSAESVSPYVRKDRQFKTFKPLTPSLRWVRYPRNEHLWKGKPERDLTIAKRSTGGRNHHGHVTVRGRGGGHRRRIRLVDFYRWETGEQEVVRIEYDPGRSAHIALVRHKKTGVKSYILAPDGLGEGDTVQSFRSDTSVAGKVGGANASLDLGIFRTKAIRAGNVLPLHLIPIGTMIHALSLVPGGPAKLVRSAGASGQLVAFVNRSKASPSAGGVTSSSTDADVAEANAMLESQSSSDARTTHAQVKLQSGEVRLVPVNCCATIGRVSNIDHEHRRIGKAGRSRWLGRRPKVRGVAMNACDHPHGGGRGKSKSNMHPRSIYGQKVKGPRTRKPGNKRGNRMVVRERPRRNGKRAGKA